MVETKGKLPLSLSGIRDASGFVNEQSTQAISLSVFVDGSCSAELITYAKEQLCPQVETTTLDVTFFGTAAPCVDDQVTLLVILAAQSTVVGEALAYAKRHFVPAVVLTLHPKQVQQQAEVAEFHLDALEIVGPDPRLSNEQERLVSAFDALGAWIVRNLGDQRLAFARALPFVRRPLAREITRSTAYQNAAIAAVFFLPGADMPLLTLNQAKMMLQIAGAFGLPVGTERIKELVFLLISAFGFRALARKLVGLVPVIG
ncbi:MAG: hypothetical protein LBU48_03510, partial [Coriobacteriales bacterium]|nr:hypothetical protein [Coriobacteriales bacterium]